MRTKLLTAIALFVISACKKDVFTTTPQITLQSVSTQVVPVDGNIIFTLEYTDKEGDIQDSLLVKKETRNCIQDTFTTYYAMPADLPTQSNTKGDIEVRYSHGTNLQFPDIGDPQCAGNDTCIFKFVLKDKAGHRSDTAYSPEIVIIKR